MSYQAPRLSIVKDNIVRVHHPETIEPSTYLTDNALAGGTSLTVKNNAGFANGDVLLIGSYGAKGAELKKVNGAVSAGASLTVTALTFGHSISGEVSKLLFNQVEISGANTPTGSKTVIATTDINVSGPFTDYVIAGSTYSYYFARFYNSLNSSPYFGAYSDATSASDYDPKNVGFIRRLAFENIDQEYTAKYASNSNWIYDQIYLCELDVLKKKVHSSELTVLNYDMGNVTTGMQSVALPSDIEDPNTGKSILGLRVGTRENMTYVDRPDFETLMEGTAVTTSSVTAIISATTLTLTDSRDFEDSGTITIDETSYSYTNNDRTTGVLSGFTAFTAEITSGSTVWQNVTFGEPRRFTIDDSTLYFDVPPSSDLAGRNIWIDYIRGANRPDSDGDSVLFASNPQLYITWLEKAIKNKKLGGNLPITDSSVIAYEAQKAQHISQDRNQVGVRLIPNIPAARNRRPYYGNR